MITELTAEQELKIEEYVTKHTNNCRRTTRINKDEALKGVEFLYETILEQKVPKEIIFMASPLQCIEEINKRTGKKEFVSEDRSNLWASYYYYYDYILNELMPEQKEDFKDFLQYLEVLKECHKFYMYDDLCLISDFPTILNVNADDDLHSTTEASLEYSDGFKMHSLNGITVSEEIALCKPENITKDMILKEVNADIRREIVRKLTAEQLVSVLDSKILDSEDGYELLGIDLGDNRVRPFLKMNNPSMDLVHVEGVHPDCKTVKSAIAWRNTLETFEHPSALS